jgi:hypothetical protein
MGHSEKDNIAKQSVIERHERKHLEHLTKISGRINALSDNDKKGAKKLLRKLKSIYRTKSRHFLTKIVFSVPIIFSVVGVVGNFLSDSQIGIYIVCGVLLFPSLAAVLPDKGINEDKGWTENIESMWSELTERLEQKISGGDGQKIGLPDSSVETSEMKTVTVETRFDLGDIADSRDKDTGASNANMEQSGTASAEIIDFKEHIANAVSGEVSAIAITKKEEPSEAVDGENIGFEEHLTQAKSGDVFAMVEVAIAYKDGNLVEENQQEAFNWYKAAAEAGDPNAMFSTGLRYYGFGGLFDPPNLAEALFWFCESLKNGVSDDDGTISGIIAEIEISGKVKKNSRQRKVGPKVKSKVSPKSKTTSVESLRKYKITYRFKKKGGWIKGQSKSKSIVSWFNQTQTISAHSKKEAREKFRKQIFLGSNYTVTSVEEI